MFTLMFFPFKLLISFLKLSGVKGALLLAIGVGIGLLLAPERGEIMRARLRAKINEARTGVPPIEADLLI
ncbi:MAG: YtxH domain-containing protein [Aquihabitans sp.]